MLRLMGIVIMLDFEIVCDIDFERIIVKFGVVIFKIGQKVNFIYIFSGKFDDFMVGFYCVFWMSYDIFKYWFVIMQLLFVDICKVFLCFDELVFKVIFSVVFFVDIYLILFGECGCCQ